MRQIMKLWTVGLTILSALGCADSYSIREQFIIGQIPAEQKNYKGGIVCDPTDEDIKTAIALGIASKDTDTLEYAYNTKLPRGFFDEDYIYLKVETPLYRISNHAREQAREYRQVDQKFIEFVRKRCSARISLTQEYVSTAVPFRQYAFQRQIMLLRDGIRVEPLKEVFVYAGQNPFSDTLSIARHDIAKSLQALAQIGLENEESRALSPVRDEILGEKKIEKQVRSFAVPNFNAIFSVEELRKPGNYEVLFRTPPVICC